MSHLSSLVAQLDVWSSRGRCWDYTFGWVLDAASSEREHLPAPELFKCQLAPYLAGLQALMLPGCINFQSQVFTLCFEILSFRIPELLPKMSAPPQTSLLGRSARSAESLVQPCPEPGGNLDCPALGCAAALLLSSSGLSWPFPAWLSLQGLTLQRQRTLTVLLVQ